MATTQKTNYKICSRCSKLEKIILDIHWMARRYANLRRSYAPNMFNDAMEEALKLGLPLKEDTIENPPTIYAKDGMDDGLY